MSFGDRMIARASAFGARIAALRVEEVASAIAVAGGIALRREGRRLRLTGRGLVRRFLAEPLLRFAGRR